MKALDGLRIVDLTTLISGPYGSMLLADMGAEVIKVEPPGGGDVSRTLQEDDPDYHYQGMSSYFLTLGRNKRSVVLDLHAEDGRSVLHDLVRSADVVIDNYRPGVLERLAADYATLREINPRIICCSITGYGLTGPGKDRAAFDACIQAFSGVMSITGVPGGDPVRTGIPYADLCAGMAGALGILAAVAAREHTGVGQHVDISMLDVQLSMWNYIGTMHLMSGHPTPRLGNEHFVHVPYNAYKTTEGYLFVAVIPDPHWAALAAVVANAKLPSDLAADVAFLQGEQLAHRSGRQQAREALNTALGRVLMARPRDAWLAEFTAAGVPCAPVNSVAQAFSDPQVRAREMVVRVEHPSGGAIPQPGNPIKLSGSAPGGFAPPPLLGAHTAAVLREVLGYDDARIEVLLGSGAATQGASSPEAGA